ncbi:hypothetical protein BT93_L1286 [Corymbia citriodora subsp. variegata]|uniref:Uncharacterized protein n=1 Tax=Corymbia citriodora subsp. variegata TaxID=360336 RepID=A0A8T0CSJ0_CORYI|nr:hypothetical protein BT93_L1286 [Corymbia citriodora subsp. variegata]
MAFKLAQNFSIWLILVLCTFACASNAASRAFDIPSATKKFEEWMSRHGRDYKDVAEKAKRLKIFSENLRFIEEFNGAANRTYKVGLNKFSDLTNEEFVAAYTGYKLPSSSTRRNSSQVNSFKYQGSDSIPESVDWVKKGAVNPIKNQERCGSCWSFSVVAAVEAITQITSGVLPNLSEQQLIDCATNGNQGCRGGWMDNGFEYIINNHGINSESNYPYVGVDGTCNMQASSVAKAKISDYRDVSPNEDDMLKAVVMQPVSVALDSSGAAFQNYAGGVFIGPCGTNLNHAVTVVGYGTDTDGTKYWLIRNSWDVSWGESGYMRIQRDSGVEGGLCGIASKVSYPIA